MGGWSTHTGLAVALPLDNIDTDQLIPARFMSVPRAEGYGDYLLHDLRRGTDGTPDPAFPLNHAPEASVLVAGRNFGSGSSREAAVYALVDAGFRAVIAPGFGDIFAANAVNNGLLPARILPEDWDRLMNALTGADTRVSIDLSACTVSLNDLRLPFSLDEGWRTKLVNGWDDIDLTFQHAAEIDRFRAERARIAPWVWPQGRTGAAH